MKPLIVCAGFIEPSRLFNEGYLTTELLGRNWNINILIFIVIF